MRMIWSKGTALTVLSLLPGCGHGTGGGSDRQRPSMQLPAGMAAPVGMTGDAAWRGEAKDQDRDRLRRLRDAYTQAAASARAAGQGAALDALGTLADPDAALDRPALPPGEYRCRTVKLGTRTPLEPNRAGQNPGGQNPGGQNPESQNLTGQQPAGPGVVAYPGFACRVEVTSGGMRFVKTGGSQRPQGALYPDDGSRLIFLGSIALGDEQAAQPYGSDDDRNMIGVVERIGPQRWRMALPFPKWESLLDLIEIEPAA